MDTAPQLLTALPCLPDVCRAKAPCLDLPFFDLCSLWSFYFPALAHISVYRTTRISPCSPSSSTPLLPLHLSTISLLLSAAAGYFPGSAWLDCEWCRASSLRVFSGPRPFRTHSTHSVSVCRMYTPRNLWPHSGRAADTVNSCQVGLGQAEEGAPEGAWDKDSGSKRSAISSTRLRGLFSFLIRCFSPESWCRNRSTIARHIWQ